MNRARRTRSATRLGLLVIVAVLAVGWTAMATCPPCQPGTGTPGYWKNHPDAWPVEQITIGGMIYNKDDAIAAIKEPVKGDKTYTLFPALVAAKLNVLIGNCSCCICETIQNADAWMELYPLDSGVAGSSCAWKQGEPLYLCLDKYNNGLLCAPSRDEVESDDGE